MEVFSRFHQTPFSKMLTFYRREAFSLQAKYNPNDIPYSNTSLGQPHSVTDIHVLYYTFCTLEAVQHVKQIIFVVIFLLRNIHFKW